MKWGGETAYERQTIETTQTMLYLCSQTINDITDNIMTRHNKQWKIGTLFRVNCDDDDAGDGGVLRLRHHANSRPQVQFTAQFVLIVLLFPPGFFFVESMHLP